MCETLVDENLPTEAAKPFRQAGYDARTVTEQGINGSPDSEVISVCGQENRVLITLDTDFADIRLYPPAHSAGLIVLRLQKQDKCHVLDVLIRLLKVIPKEPVEERLWIVEEAHIRVRD